MKNLIQKISALVGAGVMYLAGEYFRGEWFVGTKLGVLCHPYIENAKVYCHSSYLDFGLTLIAAGEIFAIVGVILLFANASGFRAWWKVSAWYVPIVALFIIFAAPLPLFPVVAPMSRESLVWFFGVIYIVLSLGAVLRGRVLERRSS